jgi:hypothetical protein
MDWNKDGAIYSDCAVFYRVNEKFGGLSNMSNEYFLV